MCPSVTDRDHLPDPFPPGQQGRLATGTVVAHAVEHERRREPDRQLEVDVLRRHARRPRNEDRRDTALAQIARLVEDAQTGKASVQRRSASRKRPLP